jgi:tetratricopeptide repeat protein
LQIAIAGCPDKGQPAQAPSLGCAIGKVGLTSLLQSSRTRLEQIAICREVRITVVGNIRYPVVDPDEVTGEAWAAIGRGDSDEALRLWQRLRQDFPERPDGYVWPIQVLWQDGRVDEANALAAEALARFPENPDVLVQCGWIAMARERWDEALRWWAAVRARAPDRRDGYLWAARALWKLSRFEDAETMAAEALDRFPGDPDVETERAWVAVNRGDWEAALARWKRVLAAQPGRGEAEVRLIQAMRFAGQLDEAETAAAEALGRRPGDPHLLAEHIWAAADRADWAAVTARLAAARESLEAAALFEATSDALQARRQAAPGGASFSRAPTRDRKPADAISIADLMLSFESLGERCDLGSVQRHYGVEPPGLLRFGFGPLNELIAALEDRFGAIGTGEDTEFETSEQDEAILKSRKHGLMFHTFVSKNQMAVSFGGGGLKIWRLDTPKRRDAFREEQLRRLVHLKDGLIGELEKSQKIFAYSNDERTSEDDAARLFTALRAYGPNSLLYVRPADAAHPEGTVTKLRDGLYLGHYPGLTDFVAGQQPAFEVWRQLLQRTYRLAQEN